LHTYEGVENESVRRLIRTLYLLGCRSIFLSNAAGSVDVKMPPGSLMAINDHINFQFQSVLTGSNDSFFGDRFVSLTNAYDKNLMDKLRLAAKQLQLKLHEGVYLAASGPHFETPAEIKAFAILGANAVGMSTVPEVIVARHCGMRVAAVSVITNLAAGLSEEVLSHEQTLKYASKASDNFVKLVLEFIKQL
jgi:xanthosine phosphorylase